jgi:hypothetical protein
MKDARKPVNRYIKIVVILVSAISLFFGVVVVYVVYADWSAERKARAFCGEIALGSNVSIAIDKAKGRKILYGPHEGSYQGYNFYFPGSMFNNAVCEVSVDKDGKVLAKGSVMEYD